MDPDRQNLTAFLTGCCEVRKAQREYFRSRGQERLEHSKRVESAFDARVEDFRDRLESWIAGGPISSDRRRIIEMIRAYQDMRAAQKRYFAGEGGYWESHSRLLERELDRKMDEASESLKAVQGTLLF